MTETLAAVYAAVGELTEQGMGAKEIARTLSIGTATVYRARKAGGAARWEGTPYTCEECERVTLCPSRSGTDPRDCPRCGSPAYPQVSDTEALKRLTALVKRLEAEGLAT